MIDDSIQLGFNFNYQLRSYNEWKIEESECTVISVFFFKVHQPIYSALRHFSRLVVDQRPLRYSQFFAVQLRPGYCSLFTPFNHIFRSDVGYTLAPSDRFT